MNEETFPGPIQIPLSKGQEWEERYVDDNSVEDSKKKVTAFLIPRETLVKVLELKTEAVWAHLGINDDKEKTLIFNGAEYDPSTGKYKNVYGPPKGEKSKSEAEAEEVVYDGTRPSPPF
ncbi:hypothetical protein [Flavobacterium aquidurense]|uniref:hypothetical protein n=1 Tax=Flavobacterium aquidurense TaxID=362413 RepID=UPI00285DABA2|nr:hypothetical protein [Flavobacterium aquidurense]MDR7373011.1 hypothetical protein [Flavobacterium aquidurense]